MSQRSGHLVLVLACAASLAAGAWAVPVSPQPYPSVLGMPGQPDAAFSTTSDAETDDVYLQKTAERWVYAPAHIGGFHVSTSCTNITAIHLYANTGDEAVFLALCSQGPHKLVLDPRRTPSLSFQPLRSLIPRWQHAQAAVYAGRVLVAVPDAASAQLYQCSLPMQHTDDAVAEMDCKNLDHGSIGFPVREFRHMQPAGNGGRGASVFFATDQGGLYRWTASAGTTLVTGVPVSYHVDALAYSRQHDLVIVGTHYAVYLVGPDGKPVNHIWARNMFGGPISALSVRETTKNDAIVYVGCPKGVATIDLTTMRVDTPRISTVPYGPATSLSPGCDAVWAGTPRGAMRRGLGGPRGTRWHFYLGHRWLAGERITAVASSDGSSGGIANCFGPASHRAVAAGHAIVATDIGVSVLMLQRFTLAKKEAHYQTLVHPRHWRSGGLVTQTCLSTPGDVSTWHDCATDNDGTWTAPYLVAQVFRHAVTHDAAAHSEAWATYHGMKRLTTCSGIKGFPARSIRPKKKQEKKPVMEVQSGRWRVSPTCAGMEFKGDTSSDEITSHMWSYAVTWQLLAETDVEREDVATLYSDILSNIIKHNFTLYDVNGRPTMWAHWGPQDLNDLIAWDDERGLNSLQMLSYLLVGAKMTGNPLFRDSFNTLVLTHQYDFNIINEKVQVPPFRNFNDDMLSMFPYHAMQVTGVLGADNPAGVDEHALARVRAATRVGMHRHAWSLSFQRNPLWEQMMRLFDPHLGDLHHAFASLRDMPLDMVLWETHNSHRFDLVFEEAENRKGSRQRAMLPDGPYPFDEITYSRLGHNPYLLDDRYNGATEQHAGQWQAAYWIGRYYKFLTEPANEVAV